MHKSALTFVLCFVFAPTFAQHTIADSVLTIKYQKEAFDSLLINPAASLALAEKEVNLSKEIGYKPGIAEGLTSMGFAYSKSGDIQNALKYEQEGLNYSRQNKMIVTEASALNRLGMLYTELGDLDKGYESYEQELTIRQQLHDKVRLADCYQNLGVTLSRQDVLDRSLSYFLIAVDMYHTLKDKEFESLTLSYISDIYMVGKQYPQALDYIRRSLNVSPNATAYGHLADYYDDMKQDDSARYYDNKALKMYGADSQRVEVLQILENLSIAELRDGDYKIAKAYIDQAMAIAKQLADLKELGNLEACLAEFYNQADDYKNAFRHQLTCTALKDSFNKKQVTSKLAELSTKFEVKEAQQKSSALQNENALQKTKLQKKNAILYGTLAALLAVLVISILLIRQNRLRASQKELVLQQKQLRAQMNPHFIFNCLNSIQHFIVANDTRNANKYLSGFASLMRQTLENSKDGTVTLHKEISYLQNYIELEHVRFENKFTFKISCAENIDTNVVEIPAMIIQPFVENAIRHGLCYLEDNIGLLKINFYKNDQYLFCEIDDNGIGMEQSQALKKNTTVTYESQGMELTRQRMELVSKNSGTDSKIEIKNKQTTSGQTGTTVTIKFPLYL